MIPLIRKLSGYLSGTALIISLVFPGCKDREYNITLQQAFKNINQFVSKKNIDNTEVTVEDLAYHWAPVHYQDIYQIDNDKGKYDYITRIDRRVNDSYIWDLELNWDKKLSYELHAFVYYSVVYTKTHFYITYSFYHPWDARIGCEVDYDYSGIFPFGECEFDQLNIKRGGNSGWDLCGTRRITALKCAGGWKKNDMEGVLLVIGRNKKFGELEAVFAQGHGYIHTYLPTSIHHTPFREVKRLRPFRLLFSDEAMKSMDDKVYRIITTQEQGGHGVGCYGHDSRTQTFGEWGAPDLGPGALDCSILACGNYGFNLPKGDDHIRYIPSRTEAEIPEISIENAKNSHISSTRTYKFRERNTFINIEKTEKRNNFVYCKYKLINMFGPHGPWYNRYQTKVFPQHLPDEGMSKKNNVSYDWRGHGSLPWNWRADKLPLEQIGKLSQDDLHLTAQEKLMVDRSSRPWTHNPHYLCWVYLKLRQGEKQNYFSPDYIWNIFRKDGE